MNFPLLSWIRRHPVVWIFVGIFILYSQFFISGKIPIPTDTLVGAYYPWLDYKWGYETGVPVKNAPISDIYSQIYLWKNLSVNLMKQGIWPLWNPYSLSGSPLLANYQSAPFLPFNIFLLIPGNSGWALFILTQTLVAAIGMYLLLKEFTSHLLAQMAGVIVFSLSGLMSTYIEFGIAVWAAAMLPWIIYSLLSFLKLQKTKYLLLMTFAFTSLYLSGHAQLAIYSTVIFFAYLFYGVVLIKDINRKQIIQPVLFWLISFGIASIQLLPSLDIVQYSIRSSEAYLKNENYGLSPIYEAIRLIAADFFGNPATVNHWDSQSYHEMSSFLGTLTLPLIVPLLLKRIRDKKIVFWGALFVVSLLLAFDNPISRFIYSLQLPLLTYSAATRILFVTSFSAAILVAYSLEKIKNDPEYVIWTRRSFVTFTTIFFLIFISMLFIRKFEFPLQNVLPEGDTLNYLNISIRNSIPPLAILITASLFFYLIRFIPKKFRSLLIMFFVAVLFVDLGRYFIKYNPFVTEQLIFPNTPILTFLQNQEGYFRIARADHEAIPPNTWMAYNLSSVEGYDPISLKNYARYFNRVNGDPYNGKPSRFVEVSKYPSKFLDALNVKYLVAVKRDEKGGIGGDFFNSQLKNADYRVVFEDKNTAVLLNPRYMPRVYFVPQVTSVKDEESLVNYLNKAEFDPTKEAVIVGDRIFSGIQTDGEVAIAEYKPNEIVIRTKSKSPVFLVLSESYDPGWQLFRDGVKEQLYNVNGALRGMYVPIGENEFRLVYWPTPFDLGLKLSVFSLIILIGANLYFVRKRTW